MKQGKNLLIVIFLSVFIGISIFPLFNRGFFQSDDGEWMVIRFSAFHQALRDKQFPVRFLGRLNHGYGYPVANFLYPVFMYIAEPIHAIGFNYQDSVKIIFGLSLVLSALFTFFWLSKIFGKFAGVVGSFVYLYTPYHLYDIYQRGSVGELLALTFVPFILWMIEQRNVFLASTGIALLILSHNTLVLLFIPLIIIYSIFSLYEVRSARKTLFFISKILLLGFGLAAFFWIPALFDLKYTVFSKTKVSDWKEYFSNMELIGISSIIILLTGIFLLILHKQDVWKKEFLKKKKSIIYFLIFTTVVSIFLSSKSSENIWQVLPVSFIQFPFRFLSVTILGTAFLASFCAVIFKNWQKYIIAAIIVALSFISSLSFLSPKEFFDKGDSFYTTNEATTTVQDEYMPLWVKQKPTQHFREKIELLQGKGKVTDVYYNSKSVRFKIQSFTDSVIRINTVYFPGWQVFLNQKKTPISYSNELGVIEFLIPRGESAVEANFTETPLRFFSDIVSLFSGFILIIIAGKRWG